MKLGVYTAVLHDRPLPDGFRYSSETNDTWLGPDALRTMVESLDAPRR